MLECILEIKESVIVRVGTWHTPFLRIIARLWPAYNSKDYIRRIAEYCEEFPQETEEELANEKQRVQDRIQAKKEKEELLKAWKQEQEEWKNPKRSAEKKKDK